MPIQTEILQTYKTNNVQYNLFYSLDGFANILLCFVTGSLLHEDRLGLNKTFNISCGGIVLGNLILALSALKGIYLIALLGRFIAGVGIEC